MGQNIPDYCYATVVSTENLCENGTFLFDNFTRYAEVDEMNGRIKQ